MAKETDKPETPTGSKRRHRGIVWTLVIVASVLLVFSITANWVQKSLLDSDQVTDTTNQMLANEDVQEQLSIFAVDQLYANVDVQGEIAAQLPPPAAPLAGVIGAAARELSTNVAGKALASPQVQNLVSEAVRAAHSRLLALIDDEGQYVSTTGGDVTLQYGAVIADLATRLGLNPATIAEIQSFIQDFSQTLKGKLTNAQSQIESVRANLAQAQAGELDPSTEESLTSLNETAADLRGTIKGLELKVTVVEDKVPSQLQDKLADLTVALDDVSARFRQIERQTGAVLDDPSTADVAALDARLAELQTRVTMLLSRQVVTNPGQLVLLKSDNLSAVQTGLRVFRNLGIVLPILVLLLYLTALFLAKGWRREALIATGGGIIGATLFVLVLRRLVGHEIDSLASSEAVKPAISAVWDILSVSLRDRARFILVIGIAFIAAGALAGPGKNSIKLRSFLAPYLRDHPVGVYSVVAGLFLLWLAFTPGIDTIGQVLVIVILAVLAAFGVEVLRRQTAAEFPPHDDAPAGVG